MKSLFKAIRVAWLGLWAAIATIILGIPVMVAGLLSRTGNLAFSISKLWAYTMLAVSFVRTEIKNKAKILKGTSYIIISNHQSLYDIIALVTSAGHSIPLVHQKGSSQNSDFRVRVVRFTEHLHRPLQYRQRNREH